MQRQLVEIQRMSRQEGTHRQARQGRMRHSRSTTHKNVPMTTIWMARRCAGSSTRTIMFDFIELLYPYRASLRAIAARNRLGYSPLLRCQLTGTLVISPSSWAWGTLSLSIGNLRSIMEPRGFYTFRPNCRFQAILASTRPLLMSYFP